MGKIKCVARKTMALLLAVVVLAASIDTKAFADTGLVMYGGNYFDSIVEAISAAREEENITPEITVTAAQTLEETIKINDGETITIRANEQLTLAVETDLRAVDIDTGGTLKLINIIVDGKRGDGRVTNTTEAVNINGSMEMYNSEVSNFYLTKAAVLINNATLTMDATSRIYNNQHTETAGSGGGIKTSGICHITGGIIEGNRAGYYGGGIQNNGTLYIDGTTIKGNTAFSTGAGINGSNLYVKGCTFIENSIGYNGGAVAVNKNCVLEIYNSKFINNSADNSGASAGAIKLYNNVKATLAGVTMEGNVSRTGGAISTGTGTMIIKQAGNYETEAFGTITTTDNSFANNKGSSGGAIAVGSSGYLTIEQADFTGNTASNGGAIYNSGTTKLHKAVINGNVATGTNINNLEVQKGNGIYNNGTLELYKEVEIKDQVYLEAEKFITVKERPEKQGSGAAAIKVAVAEAIGDEFRVIVEYDTKKSDEDTENNPEADAYDSTINNKWYLESVENQENIVAKENQVGLQSVIYTKSILCVDNSGASVHNVVFELYKEKVEGYISLGSTPATDADGNLVIGRLQEGSYCIVARSLPEGYEKTQPRYDFSVGLDVENEILVVSVGDYNEAPNAVITAEKTEAKAGEKIYFSAENSTDDHGIASYEWGFGDGTTKKGKNVSYMYSVEGTYVVILKIIDTGGRTSTTNITMTIEGIAQDVTSLVVSVKSSSRDEAIPKAGVYITDAEGEVLTEAKTASDGTCELLLKNGENYGLTVMASGYIPRSSSICMDGTKDSVTVYLSDSNTVVGELTSKELTKEQAEAVGIDTTKEENHRVVEHRLTLTFTEETTATGTKVPVTFFTDSNDQVISNPKVYGDAASGKKIITKGAGRQVYFLVVDGTTKWLKDFFNVQLIVYNNSSTENIEDCTAKLNLPDGLALAAMKDGIENNIEKTIGTIAPGKNKSTEWYVRGDEDGEYQISATVNGELNNEQSGLEATKFEYEFVCDELLRVTAGSALHVEIEINKHTATGEGYPVIYRYTNVSDKTVYGLKFYFDRELQYADDGAVFKDIEPGTFVEKDELAPGESVAVTYIAGISFVDEDGNPIAAKLMGHAFDIVGGNASLSYNFKIIENPVSALAKSIFGPDSFRIHAGDPVDMLTGTFEYNYVDYTIKGRHDLVFERYYSSGNSEDVGLGKGFKNGYSYSLEITDEQVKVRYPNGAGVTFDVGGNGNYAEATGRKLEKSDSGYIFIDTGRKYTFDNKGNLKTITEEDGWETKITHDSDGNIVGIESPAGRIDLEWSDNHITKMIAGGMETIYAYDNEGHLTSAKNPDGDVMLYQYSKDGFVSDITDFEGNIYLINKYDKDGRVTEQTVADEGKYTFSYDDENRINICEGELGYVRMVKYDSLYRVTEDDEEYNTKYEYNAFGQLIRETDPDGEKVYSYDANGNVTTIIYPDNTTEYFTYDDDWKLKEYKNRNDKVITYEYNTEGFLIKETDTRGNATTYEYDEKGNRIREKSPEGNIFNYAYNDAGQVLIKTDSKERMWEYSYDDSGRTLTEKNSTESTKTYVYTNAGKLTHKYDDMGVTYYGVNKNGYDETVTDQNGGVTQKYYNAANKVIKEISPEEYVTEFKYDARGNLTMVIFDDGEQVSYVYDKNGNVISWTDEKDNTWSNEYDEKGRLISVTDPYKNSSKKEYDVNGNVIKETDENGAVTEYTYDFEGNLLSEKDPLDNEITYEYDGNGNMTAVKDKNGNVTLYTYDKDNRLISESNQKGNTSYTYDGLDNIIKKEETGGIITLYEYNGEGKLLSMTDPEGNETTYSYDIMGNLTQVNNPDNGVINYTYDKKGNCLSVKDAAGFTESYEYDAEDRIIKKLDGNGNEYTYTYDFRGNEKTVVSPLYTTEKHYDERGLLKTEETPLGTKTYEYDSLGRLTEEKSAGGRVIKYTYDKTGNPITITDGNEKVTTYEYYADGNVKSVTDPEGGKESYKYDGNGNLIEKTDPEGNVTTYTYDSMNNMTSETDALGNVKSFEYDYKGNLVKYTDAEGTETTYGYDKNGNNTSITDGLGNAFLYYYDQMGRKTMETSPEGTVRKYSYDFKGNIISETDGRGNTTKYEYDCNGNITKKVKGSWVETYTYDSLNRLTETVHRDGTSESYTYDINGNVLTYTDKKGNVTSHEYDRDNNLTKTTDALGNETSYEYDGAGNMIKVIMYREKDNENTREETVYEYDGNNRVVKMTNAMGVVDIFEYDKNGNLKEKKNADGKVLISYEYGETGLLMSKAEGENTKATYCYNKNGELVSMETPDNTVKYTRDSLDRITEININNIYTVKNEYDADGNRTKLIYPDESEVSYEYDGNGNITKVTEGEKVTEYEYTPDDKWYRRRINGKLNDIYIYNTAGNITSVYQATPEGYMSSTDLYTYDAAGNITSHMEISTKGNVTYSYEYDAMGRLTGESYTKDSVEYNNEYSYDGTGNLVQEVTDGKTLIYEYNNLNQLVRKYDESDMFEEINYLRDGTGYGYDWDGNLVGTVRIAGYSKDVTASYDSEGNIVSSTKMVSSGGCKDAQSTYTYDGAGNLIKTRTRKTYYDHMSDITTTKIYDYTKEVPTILAEYSTDGTMIKYTYGEDNEKLTVSVRNSLALAYQTPKSYDLDIDIRGSVTAAKDSDGVEVATAEYNVWGEVTRETGIYINAVVGTLMFAASYIGYSYERDLRWWNAGARLYDASSRRFVSPDPESGNVYEPLRINRYIYAGDNPVNNIDPDGRSFVGATFAKIGCRISSWDGWQKLDRVRRLITDNVVVKKTTEYINVVMEAFSSLPTVAKYAIGLGGMLVYIGTGGSALTAIGAGLEAFSYGASAGAATYAFESIGSGSWNNSDFLSYISEGAADGISITGAGLGLSGVFSFFKKNNFIVDMADETGCFGYESGKKTTPGFDEWLNKGSADNKVYFGIDKNNNPKYTGITKQTKDARLAQHNKNGKGFLDLEIQYENLTRNQARAIEQYFIENGPNELNKINSIGQNNKYYQDALNWAKKYLGK